MKIRNYIFTATVLAMLLAACAAPPAAAPAQPAAKPAAATDAPKPTEAAKPAESPKATEPPAEAAGMDALIAEAKKEGELNVIALPRDWCNYGKMIDTFKAKYGLKVNEINPDAALATNWKQ